MATIPNIQLVQSVDDIRGSLATFNSTARRNSARARNIVRRTTYWVFDPVSKTFAPGKFAGYKAMTFAAYESAAKGNFRGDRFDGHTSQTAIAAVTDEGFEQDDDHAEALKLWGEQLFGENVLDRVDESKWRFVALKPSGKRPSFGGSSVGQDDVAALVGSADGDTDGASGQGFGGSPERRKAVELRAMKVAEQWLRSQGWLPTDTSATKPYDFTATRGKESIFVEVKGSSAAGEHVILTRNEVEHAKAHKASMVLIVVHDIAVEEADGDATASGGTVRVFQPWDIGAGALEALAFKYRLPDRRSGA